MHISNNIINNRGEHDSWHGKPAATGNCIVSIEDVRFLNQETRPAYRSDEPASRAALATHAFPRQTACLAHQAARPSRM
jgi:hypothetical protein